MFLTVVSSPTENHLWQPRRQSRLQETLNGKWPNIILKWFKRNYRLLLTNVDRTKS